MTRTEALKDLIASLEAEIAAIKAFDVDALAAATEAKALGVDLVAGSGGEPITPEVRALADQASRLNETARIYVNLMSANVRRRLDALTGTATPLYHPTSAAA